MIFWIILSLICSYLTIGLWISWFNDFDYPEFALIVLFWLPYYLFKIICWIFEIIFDVLFSLGD